MYPNNPYYPPYPAPQYPQQPMQQQAQQPLTSQQYQEKIERLESKLNDFVSGRANVQPQYQQQPPQNMSMMIPAASVDYARNLPSPNFQEQWFYNESAKEVYYKSFDGNLDPVIDVFVKKTTEDKKAEEKKKSESAEILEKVDVLIEEVEEIKKLLPKKENEKKVGK